MANYAKQIDDPEFKPNDPVYWIRPNSMKAYNGEIFRVHIVYVTTKMVCISIPTDNGPLRKFVARKNIKKIEELHGIA